MGFRATVALCFALVSLQALPSSRGNGVSEICRDVAFGTIDSDIPLTVNIVAEFADWEVAWPRMHKQLDYSWNTIEGMRMGWVKARALDGIQRSLMICFVMPPTRALLPVS